VLADIGIRVVVIATASMRVLCPMRPNVVEMEVSDGGGEVCGSGGVRHLFPEGSGGGAVIRQAAVCCGPDSTNLDFSLAAGGISFGIFSKIASGEGLKSRKKVRAELTSGRAPLSQKNGFGRCTTAVGNHNSLVFQQT
jgi:hypothetical protein